MKSFEQSFADICGLSGVTRGRLLGGTDAPLMFVVAGEVGWLFVNQTGRLFLGGGNSINYCFHSLVG
jgi:hypothetical protein